MQQNWRRLFLFPCLNFSVLFCLSMSIWGTFFFYRYLQGHSLEQWMGILMLSLAWQRILITWKEYFLVPWTVVCFSTSFLFISFLTDFKSCCILMTFNLNKYQNFNLDKSCIKALSPSIFRLYLFIMPSFWKSFVFLQMFAYGIWLPGRYAMQLF